MKVSDLLLTLDSGTRIIVYEYTGALFDSYLFETNLESNVWTHYRDRKVTKITPSGSESNVLKIILCKEGTENGK